MKRILLVGDFISNTGPATVNKQLKLHFGNKISYSEKDSIRERVLELIIKTKKYDVVCFSGFSKVNIIGMLLTKIFGKKSAYLMHGYGIYEDRINGESSLKRFVLENLTLHLSNSIICVSKPFMKFMMEERPALKKKLDYVNNGIDLGALEKNRTFKVDREDNVILSVGGGMPRKKILKVCEALDLINRRTDLNLKFIVIGKSHLHTEEICKYPFVQYIENVPYDLMGEYYSRATLYVQNSVFETFGLAVIEALNAGCNLLISKNVGVKSAFKNQIDQDIIEDCDDVIEISDKILYNLKNSNNQRLKSSLDNTMVDIKETSKRLIEIL